MLVLSRKTGEKLIINGEITVEVVKIQGNRITLGIAAPSDVRVLRSELRPSTLREQDSKLVVKKGVLSAR